MSESDHHTHSRYRSLPYKASFYWAVIWTLMYWCCTAVTITLVVMFIVYYEQGNGILYKRPIMLAFGATIFTMVVSYYQRRTARCPLCIGTPLINTGALTHKRSTKFGPISEGYTSVLSIALTQKFRCMYCGTRYDLLKMSRRKKHGQDQSEA